MSTFGMGFGRWLLFGAAGLTLLGSSPAHADPRSTLAERIESIMNRPEYRHSRFGMKFYSLEDERVLFELNADEMFIPGSAAKLFPTGVALDALGADHRFRTKVYGTGPVVDGVLRGDLVLVASGDFNLSNRIRPDGTLAFKKLDHTYDTLPGAAVVEGDPLAVIRDLARQVAAKGVKRIEGYVRVDATLFQEGVWPQEMPNTPVSTVISPIMVNDNVIDVTIEPGQRAGEPARLSVSPQTAYVRFVNETKTVDAKSPSVVQFASDIANEDGTRTVTVAGMVAQESPALLRAYRVASPRRFAEMALAEALSEAGLQAKADLLGNVDFSSLSKAYTDENQLAEHVSPTLAEAVKVVLKVSHNPHAAAIPYLLGALVAKNPQQANIAGFGVQRAMFEKAGLDLTAMAQSDGAGVNTRVTPSFMVSFLEYIWRQPYFKAYFEAQPILGRDGTLADTHRDSPAAGRVRAKTGTDAVPNFVTVGAFLNGKGLGGYIEGPDGRMAAFALFVNFVPTPDFPAMERVGDDLAAIAAAVYESMAPSGAAPGRSKRSAEVSDAASLIDPNPVIGHGVARRRVGAGT